MHHDEGRAKTGPPKTAGANPEPGDPPADPYPGLFRRVHRIKQLDPLPGQSDEDRRVVEIDMIVASVSHWQLCQERNEGVWDAVNLDGVIIAERTIG